jgi:2-(1,2-epoxy-1,2-dihydrophenyl)acetyl-CoA isomerase
LVAAEDSARGKEITPSNQTTGVDDTAKESKKLVLSRIESNVGYITLDRPEYLNAFNLDLAEQFLSILDDFEKDESVRAIVLRGSGKAFSAGGDIKEMLGDVRGGKDPAAYFRAPLAAFHRIVLSLRNTPKPVLAAVHGAAAGFAFNLMLACDLRIAQEGTRFSQAFVKVGLSPDGGGTYFLPRLVGHARACELVMLPGELDAKKALEWGLINRIVPAASFEDEVKRTAEALARGPAGAMGMVKSLLNQAYDRPLAAHMEAERLAQIENAASPDFEEGLRAFIEKRQPEFNRQRRVQDPKEK